MTRFIRFTLATAAMALATAGASALEPRTGVKLRALDKITGTSTDLTEIHALAPESKRITAAEKSGKEVRGPQPVGPDGLLFSGWMFASSPGLSALEHPTYDVWVISCNASTPGGQ
jgi:hypothetical protein